MLKDTFASNEIVPYQYSRGTSPLSDWYDDIRNTPFPRLSESDLTRAVRQKLGTHLFMNTVILKLIDVPYADVGELFFAVRSMPASFWKDHPESRKLFLEAIPAIEREAMKLWSVNPYYEEYVDILLDEMAVLGTDLEKM